MSVCRLFAEPWQYSTTLQTLFFDLFMTQATAIDVVMRLFYKSKMIIPASILTIIGATSCTQHPLTQVRVKTSMISGSKSDSLPSVIMRSRDKATITINHDVYKGEIYHNLEVDFITKLSRKTATFQGELTDLKLGHHTHFGPFLIDGKSHTVKLNKKVFSVSADLIYADGYLVNKR